MKIAKLDNNVKNILLRHVENRFRHHEKKMFSEPSKITYDIDHEHDDPVVKSILNLAIWQFMDSGIYVKHDQGEIIYEKYDKNNKNDEDIEDIEKIQCDNDLYYFQKYHTCMFILQCNNENENFFKVYQKKFDIFEMI